MTKQTNTTQPAVKKKMVNAIAEDEIDLNLIGSFPASDYPSWTLGADNRTSPDTPEPPER